VLVHAGGEGAGFGVPPAVLRVDRRVVRHDRGADTGDGAADGYAAEEGQCLLPLSPFVSVFVSNKPNATGF
jgi:hypothetical protein